MAYLRAILCRAGPEIMYETMRRALEGLSPTSPYRATMFHTPGLAALLEGDLEQADASFAHAYDLAISLDTSPISALVLAEQFLVAVEREDWTVANALIKRSLEIVTGAVHSRATWTIALVYAAAAHAAAHRGALPEARRVRWHRASRASPAAYLCAAGRFRPSPARVGVASAPRAPRPT